MTAREESHSLAVNKEIEKRQIKLTEPLKSMKWYPRLELLKKHELGILSSQPGGASIAGKAMTWKDIKDILPQSDELKALIPEIRSKLAEKRTRS